MLEDNSTVFSTVEAILMKSLDICNQLCSEIVLVFNQAIYSKDMVERRKI